MATEFSTQQQSISDDIRRQHVDILEAVQELEAALASPAVGRFPEWNRRLVQELVPVAEAVTEHCLAAESEDGLVRELERELGGRPWIMRLVSEEHQTLVTEIGRFLASLESAEDRELIRAEAARIIRALRLHQAHEADLIYEAFCRDIGVGD
jgi:hypothetical protein